VSHFPYQVLGGAAVLDNATFLCQVEEFPTSYLGMPLSLKKLPKAALQPLVDKMADKLPTWKGRLL
jgi:hypothetical protein